MTHYRLSLTRGRVPFLVLVSEKHSFSASIPTGWWNALKAGVRPRRSIHLTLCGTDDDLCGKLMRPETDAGTHPDPKSPTTPTPGAK